LVEQQTFNLLVVGSTPTALIEVRLLFQEVLMRYLFALAIAAIVSPVLAQEGVRVTGTGRASVVPTCAHVSVAVVNTLPRASESLQANAKTTDKVFSALKTAGINEADIKTVDFRIDPQYEYSQQNGQRKFVGYRTNNTISIKTDKIKDLGDLLDVIVSNGANEVNGIHFEGNSAKANEDALKEAVSDAKQKAEVIAKEGGFQLGPIISIGDPVAAVRTPSPYMEESPRMAKAMSSIAAGTNTVYATVSVVFSIKK
jgi:uncharacterized protein YggE